MEYQFDWPTSERLVFQSLRTLVILVLVGRMAGPGYSLDPTTGTTAMFSVQN
jgi:hypothetical protein